MKADTRVNGFHLARGPATHRLRLDAVGGGRRCVLPGSFTRPGDLPSEWSVLEPSDGPWV